MCVPDVKPSAESTKSNMRNARIVQMPVRLAPPNVRRSCSQPLLEAIDFQIQLL
jgi:hypothetical protein